MKKLFYVFIILLLFGLPSLLDISIYGAGPKKSADADHTEQPAPAGKEGNMNPVEVTSLEIQKTIRLDRRYEARNILLRRSNMRLCMRLDSTAAALIWLYRFS